MIYWILFLHFSICTILIFIGCYIYGIVLKYLGKKGFFFKHIISALVYLIFAIYIVLPLLLPFTLIEDLHLKLKNEILINVFLFLGYILCLFPGILFFKNKFLKDLKKLGYFVK
ncbi:hypothetical protein F957_02436 [Acinetobacter gyllenbergii CIP 110306 = MTCC 11365]|uniref:Uncharacterized protein n=1 Tax=Acinetobacter gyllenbergii CIP 110306 = MTCC 11365 TaxID=1217657 RepID=A0A829HFD4_9GAMM|nr:hypothetical protein F957_02436 [Acinetobacter gyllenbergii CIP 110306 = MTCC 11365]